MRSTARLEASVPRVSRNLIRGCTPPIFTAMIVTSLANDMALDDSMSLLKITSRLKPRAFTKMAVDDNMLL